MVRAQLAMGCQPAPRRDGDEYFMGLSYELYRLFSKEQN